MSLRCMVLQTLHHQHKVHSYRGSNTKLEGETRWCWGSQIDSRRPTATLILLHRPQGDVRLQTGVQLVPEPERVAAVTTVPETHV